VDLAGLMSGPGEGARYGRRILVLNPGSSSLKASLVEPPEATLARAEVSWGIDASRNRERASAVEDLLRRLGDQLGTVTPTDIDAVGYRIVHGGARFTAATRIDAAVIAGIRAVSDLAPLHNGVALEAIEAGLALLPSAVHVACFDTAFHATLDESAYRYPVPEGWTRDWGLRRFGFHGLSVAWSTRRTARLLGRSVHEIDLVVAHLGNGCSVTAVAGGRSVATSMGLTPLEGLMMGTRSGSIDPGLLLHVLTHGLASVEEVGDALDHASGLLGVSGRTSDMRTLLESAAGGDARAELAIAMFSDRAAAWIAAVATSLPRVDALVFTGGIGEHAADVRRRTVARLAVLGVSPLTGHEPADPGSGDVRLDDGSGPTAVLRVEAREDLVIADETDRLLAIAPRTGRRA
jgi:acetate kinase